MSNTPQRSPVNPPLNHSSISDKCLIYSTLSRASEWCDKCDRDKYANYKGITPGNEHLHKYKCYHFNNYKTRNLNPSEFNEPSIYFVHFHVWIRKLLHETGTNQSDHKTISRRLSSPTHPENCYNSITSICLQDKPDSLTLHSICELFIAFIEPGF